MPDPRHYREFLTELATGEGQREGPELAEIVDRRIAIIKDYAASFSSMTDDKAADLAKTSFKIESDRSKLREKYYKKMRKELGGVIAARFWQVDGLIQDLLDLQIAQELPIVMRTKAEPEK